MLPKPEHLEKPPPGSKAAQGQGCICPVKDNHHGQGFTMSGKKWYVYTEGCPVHDLHDLDEPEFDGAGVA